MSESESKKARWAKWVVVGVIIPLVISILTLDIKRADASENAKGAGNVGAMSPAIHRDQFTNNFGMKFDENL